MEFKVNESAEGAIAQIEEKYEIGYQNSFSEVFKIGINSDKENQTVDVLIKKNAG